MAGGGVVLFIAYDERLKHRNPADCPGALQSVKPPNTHTVQLLSLRLFMPHPGNSCDFHMVSPPSLISQKSEGTQKDKNLQSHKAMKQHKPPYTGSYKVVYVLWCQRHIAKSYCVDRKYTPVPVGHNWYFKSNPSHIAVLSKNHKS